MLETIFALGLTRSAITEADRLELLGGRSARAKMIVLMPLRLAGLAVVVRLAAGAAGAVTRAAGRKPSENATRVAALWAGELALRGMRGPLAPILAQPSWPRGAANAVAIGGAAAGGLVFLTAPVAALDDDALRGVIDHEIAHLSLGHVIIKGAVIGTLAAVIPPLFRQTQARLAPRVPQVAGELVLTAGTAAVVAMTSRRLETAADGAAIEAGNGDGLASALRFIAAHNEARAQAGLSGKLRRLLLPSRPGRGTLAINRLSERVFASHPPFQDRIVRATIGQAD